MEATKKPLYGHTSPETAYVVADYPYGRTVRTSIRYWLERKAGKGWRFVSQTLNPKTGAWNKPKASTYSEWAGAMYLDGEDHVQHTGLGRYSSEEEFKAFVETFPRADFIELDPVVQQKIHFLKLRLEGKVVWKIGGKEQPDTEADKARMTAELAVLEEVLGLLAKVA